MAVPTRIASHVSESSMAIEGMTWHGPTPLILVVDDQESNRDVLCRRLLRRGYRTREACDGTEALRMIKGEDYDLVILDVMMPGISGLAVLEQVRFTRSRADLPIIMATARDQSADIVEALRKGANDYVTKPIDFDMLGMIINARLAGVARNEMWPKLAMLNDREIEALTWVARGKTSAEIADLVSLSKRTVDFHLDNARIKLGAATRTEAAIKATIGKLIEP